MTQDGFKNGLSAQYIFLPEGLRKRAFPAVVGGYYPAVTTIGSKASTKWKINLQDGKQPVFFETKLVFTLYILAYKLMIYNKKGTVG